MGKFTPSKEGLYLAPVNGKRTGGSIKELTDSLLQDPFVVSKHTF
jgi:hypothetical protein